MLDVLFVAVLVAFFAVAWLFVRACDRIIGPEELSAGEADDIETTKAAA